MCSFISLQMGENEMDRTHWGSEFNFLRIHFRGLTFRLLWDLKKFLILNKNS